MTHAPVPRLRIGISSCLLGEKVRFDGGHKHDSLLTEVLGRFFEWVPVCPEVEIGLGDGTVHRFGPGHVTLAEDLTGKGHTTRVVGNKPRLTATIPLAD